MRIAAFNELHRAFQRDAGVRSQQEVNVVGHNHEFVKLKNPAFAIAENRIQQHPCGWFRLKHGATCPGHGGYEKYTIGKVVHGG